MDWRPIETAPKDGTAFLAYLPNRDGWVARQDITILHYSGWGGGVWEDQSCLGKRHLDEPTHWAPLPDAPRNCDS